METHDASPHGFEDEEMVEISEHDADSTGDESPPAKKRRRSRSSATLRISRTGATKERKGKAEVKLYRGRNVGKLAEMLHMPIDIFCEIAAYLEPLDILQLARSTKSFNEILMSRNSRPIWRMARRYYTDLPDCPPDLSEPAYARLVFEKNCHACLAPRAMKVDYVLRTRLCKSCRRSPNIEKGSNLLKNIPGLTTQLLECVTSRQRSKRVLIYYAPRVEALVAKFQSLVSNNILAEEASRLGEEFIIRRKNMIKDVEQHAADIERWVESGSRAKRVEEFHAERRRKESIQSKLLELGYREDELPGSGERDDVWSSIMYQPRDLTPRIWNQVRPKLEASIKKLKRLRVVKARLARREERRKQYLAFITAALSEREKRDKDLVMTVKHVYLLPTVVELRNETGDEEETTQTKWDAAWDRIENEMDQFSLDAQKCLFGLLHPSRSHTPGESPQGLDLQSLGTFPAKDETNGESSIETLHATYFTCRGCPSSSLFVYPALIKHQHPIQYMVLNAVATRNARLILSSVAEHYREEELLSMDSRLQCSRCEDSICPMNWLRLIRHFGKEQECYDLEVLRQSRDSSVKITLHNDHALDDESPAFVVLDIAAAPHQENLGYGDWRCGLCTWKKKVSSKEVESHIRRNHLKEPESADVMKIPTPSYNAYWY